jgi:hypothetical protein
MMKIVLSRKGFDSRYGGVPSPILPDGTMLPLPIPSADNPHRMCDLVKQGMNLGDLTFSLSRGRVSPDTSVHLDPDIDTKLVRRPTGWLPALGQTGAAQRHLARQGVGTGDVFLFFGWFRKAEPNGSAWRYVPGAPDLHVLFGWLQVGEVLSVVTDREGSLRGRAWLALHPHVAAREKYTDPLNTVYVAKQDLDLGEGRNAARGGGVFGRYRDALRLTATGKPRTFWRLPRWMQPSGSQPALSYHRTPNRWTVDGDSVLLRSAAIGQEFVLDADHFPESRQWLRELLCHPG